MRKEGLAAESAGAEVFEDGEKAEKPVEFGANGSGNRVS
jgi:hypothetical protein